MTSYRKFVPHFLVSEHEARGWEIVADAGGHHSIYSVLMKREEEEREEGEEDELS